jgi:hypothetical protein
VMIVAMRFKVLSRSFRARTGMRQKTVPT